MRINEHEAPWHAGLTLAAVQARHKPDADIVILNGYPIPSNAWSATEIRETDTIVLIRRGEVPTREETLHLLRARHTPRVAEAAERAVVGIAGAGGLGSHVANALTRLGVGRLLLVDYDIVEPSNLNRQLYRVEDIGLPKVEVLAAELERISPLVSIQPRQVRLTRANVAETFAGCQVVVECIDDPHTKQLVAEAVLSEMPATHVVAASGVAGTADTNRIRTRRVCDRFYLVGDGTSAAAEGVGLMAPRVMAAAGHQANAVARILLGEMETSECRS